MAWLQLELVVTPAQLEQVEVALLESGAASITLISDADEPVLEPAPGETPLWRSVRLRALLPLDVDLSSLRQDVESLVPSLFQNAQVDFVGAHDWQTTFCQVGIDRVFGERLWLQPKPQEDPPLRGSERSLPVPLYLDAGLAFGSGGHPTTALCLEWIAQHVEAGQRVVDFGCGSGILGIAAALLGAHVVSVDHDEQAVIATKGNAHYNSVSQAHLRVMSLDEWNATQNDQQDFDVVVANILAQPLIELAGDFQALLRPRGAVVLSGVLANQADAVMAAYRNTEFAAPVVSEEWARLDGSLRV